MNALKMIAICVGMLLVVVGNVEAKRYKVYSGLKDKKSVPIKISMTDRTNYQSVESACRQATLEVINEGNVVCKENGYDWVDNKKMKSTEKMSNTGKSGKDTFSCTSTMEVHCYKYEYSKKRK